MSLSRFQFRLHHRMFFSFSPFLSPSSSNSSLFINNLSISHSSIYSYFSFSSPSLCSLLNGWNRSNPELEYFTTRRLSYSLPIAKVDIIISHSIGYCVFSETSFLLDLRYARDHFLKVFLSSFLFLLPNLRFFLLHELIRC